MVKVGIIGADTPPAGEIIRILINHPETELVSLYAPSYIGRNVSVLHHGLIGESPLFFSDKLNYSDIDVLFVTNKSPLGDKIISNLPDIDDLKVITISDEDVFDAESPSTTVNFEIGISEINRKALVRGARAANIVSPVIVPVCIALFPPASFLLLNSDISITVEAPEDIAEKFNPEKGIRLLEKFLKKIQVSFNGNISMNILPQTSVSERAQTTTITLQNSLSIDEIEKIYDSIYDDHNFTFLSRNDITPKEVEGTQKTVIYLDKPDSDTLVIKIVSDPRMRGGAGDAVHVMNLFFGLHEKTGMHLKSSHF